MIVKVMKVEEKRGSFLVIGKVFFGYFWDLIDG